jgi:MFS family permease
LKHTTVSVAVPSTDRRRWAALIVVCFAQLMIVLDVTIVNVALPSIQQDLHFSQANLTWVVNAFLVTFGSLLLLAGRLGDLVGRRRVFLSGLVIFTFASLLCGVAPTQGALIAAAPAPGRRRRRPGLGDPRDHHHRVPAGRRSRPAR